MAKFNLTSLTMKPLFLEVCGRKNSLAKAQANTIVCRGIYQKQFALFEPEIRKLRL